MPRKKPHRTSRPQYIMRRITVTWTRLSLSARLERTPRGRALGGTEDSEYLYVGGTLDEPIGDQRLAEVAFYLRQEREATITAVGYLLRQGGRAVHFALYVNQRQIDQVAMLAASKSIAELDVALETPRRGAARVESWHMSSLPEELDDDAGNEGR